MSRKFQSILALSLLVLPFAQAAGRDYVETVEVDLLSTPIPAPKAAVPALPAAQAEAPVIAAARATGRSMILKATAYNSIPNQTDSTPTITATGTRTRPGVVAMSRDMLRIFPYGTRVKIEDLSGRYNFSNRVFIVEDTMHPRKTNQVDIWMPTYREAINFGTGKVRVTALK